MEKNEMFTADQLRKIVEEATPENVVVIPDYNDPVKEKTHVYKGNVRLTLYGDKHDHQNPLTYVKVDFKMWIPEGISQVTNLYEIKGVSYYNELYDILKNKDDERIMAAQKLIKDIFGV